MHHAEGVGDVVGCGTVEGSHATDPVTHGPIPRLTESCLDLILEAVGELEAAAVEEFDAVVRHRVVRCREHHAQARTVRDREVGDSGRREHAGEQHVDSGTRQAGDHSGLEELAAGPRITPDYRGRTTG